MFDDLLTDPEANVKARHLLPTMLANVAHDFLLRVLLAEFMRENDPAAVTERIDELITEYFAPKREGFSAPDRLREMMAQEARRIVHSAYEAARGGPG